MRGGVDSSRETADHGKAGISQLISEFLCRFASVMCRSPRANDSKGMMIALLNFTPDIQNNRRRVNFAKRLRIFRRALSDHRRAKILSALQLRGKIDNRFPVRNLIDYF